MTAVDLVRRIADVRAADRPTVGGKAASLGELTAAGVPVPAGVVVTTAAFDRAMAMLDPDLTLRGALEQLAPGDAEAIDRVAAPLRDRVTRAELPDVVRDAIADAYAALDPGRDPAVAVRSSATSEDSADASFAGLQDTYLWVRGTDEVLTHVRRCWASLFSVESVTYRRRLGLPEAGLAMAVAVQRMVDARVSGVMFTCSPVTGDRSVVAIEASWGLGSAMVSGLVTPDSWVVNKITGDVVSREVADKLVRHDRDESGGVVEREVPEHERSGPCLSDDRVQQLVEVARVVERHYGVPQDIEWAMPDVDGEPGPIRVLQSRPETVWATRTRAPTATPRDRPYDHVLDLLGGRRTRASRDET